MLDVFGLELELGYVCFACFRVRDAPFKVRDACYACFGVEVEVGVGVGVVLWLVRVKVRVRNACYICYK